MNKKCNMCKSDLNIGVDPIYVIDIQINLNQYKTIIVCKDCKSLFIHKIDNLFLRSKKGVSDVE